MSGFRGIPRGRIPGYSDRPFEPAATIDTQPDPERRENEEAAFGARIPEAFGDSVRLYPQLICPPLVDVSSASFRRVERWFCVGAGDYVGDVYLGESLDTRHPEFPSVGALYRPGELGFPARRWTNFNRDAKGLNLTLGTSIVNPHLGPLSPEYRVLRPGGGILIVFKMVSTDGWELEANDSIRGVQVVWRSIENGNTVTEVFDLSETAGSGSPEGRVRQLIAGFPAGITGPATFRFRLYREHSGVTNANDVAIQVELFGQRVQENQVTTFDGVTMMHFQTNSIPADRLQEYMSLPISFVGQRQTREWDSSAVRFTVQDSPGRFGDAIVQTLVDAGRSQSRYLDVGSLASVQASMERVGREEGLTSINLSDDLSVEEQVRRLCDAHRVIPWMVGSELSFQRDERRNGVALFGDRSKLEPETESVSQRDAAPVDGIAVVYFDRSFEVERSVVYPEGSPEQSVERLEIPSIGSYEAAYRRAQFEWLKRLSRGTEVQLQLTEEARHLRPGDRFFLSDSIADPGDTVDGWGVWTGDRFSVEDPDTSVISTLPGSRAVIRGPDGSVYTAAVNSWTEVSYDYELFLTPDVVRNDTTTIEASELVQSQDVYVVADVTFASNPEGIIWEQGSDLRGAAIYIDSSSIVVRANGGGTPDEETAYVAFDVGEFPETRVLIHVYIDSSAGSVDVWTQPADGSGNVTEAPTYQGQGVATAGFNGGFWASIQDDGAFTDVDGVSCLDITEEPWNGTGHELRIYNETAAPDALIAGEPITVASFAVTGGPLSDNPPEGYQQALQFILGSEANLNARSFVAATVQDNRDGSVDVTAYSYDAAVYAADAADIPRDEWLDRDLIPDSQDDGDDPD
jgi:hypothetical protein